MFIVVCVLFVLAVVLLFLLCTRCLRLCVVVGNGCVVVFLCGDVVSVLLLAVVCLFVFLMVSCRCLRWW